MAQCLPSYIFQVPSFDCVKTPKEQMLGVLVGLHIFLSAVRAGGSKFDGTS